MKKCMQHMTTSCKIKKIYRKGIKIRKVIEKSKKEKKGLKI